MYKYNHRIFFVTTRLQPCGDEHHKHHQPTAEAIGDMEKTAMRWHLYHHSLTIENLIDGKYHLFFVKITLFGNCRILTAYCTICLNLYTLLSTIIIFYSNLIEKFHCFYSRRHYSVSEPDCESSRSYCFTE
jgi:hypothetical protein